MKFNKEVLEIVEFKINDIITTSSGKQEGETDPDCEW